MLEDLLDKIVVDKITQMSLTDKLTSFLVKKKKRGTYQAMNESKELEDQITKDTLQYVREWFVNETLDGFIKKELDKQIKSQVALEISGKGYNIVLP